MNSRLHVGSALTIATCLLLFAACGTAHKARQSRDKMEQDGHYHRPYSFVHQPESRVAHAGAFVCFAVQVVPERGAQYQWSFNGQPIKDANRRALMIDHAAEKNIGGYSVEVKWTGTNIVSDEAFLGVYRMNMASGAGGTLKVSARQFLPARTQYSCPKNAGLRFEKEHTVMDSTGAPFYFYGPNVPLSSQIGPFKNWLHLPNVRVSGGNANNAGFPTAIQLMQNDAKKAKDVDCDASANSSGGPTVTLPGLSKDGREEKARYSATIYSGTTAPASGLVELNWIYF